MENNLHPDRESQRPRSMTMPPEQTQTGTKVENTNLGNAEGEEIEEESIEVDGQDVNFEESTDVDFDEISDNAEVENQDTEGENDDNDSH